MNSAELGLRDVPPPESTPVTTATETEVIAETRVEPGPPTPVAEAKQRYFFIDGLRGIAALMVVAHHFYNGAPDEIHAIYTGILPGVLEFFFRRGWFGVEIFFVISGFVIAHSVGNAAVTPGYFLNFGLRRSIRIDPPYWVALVSAVLLRQAGRVFVGHQPPVFPSIQCWLANLFYLQLWYGDMLLSVSWSLCHELQFYMLFIGLMGVFQWFLGIDPPSSWKSATLLFLLFGITGIASAVYPFQFERYQMQSCAETWHLFCCGVICYLLLHRRLPWALGWGYLVAVTVWNHDGTFYAGGLACVWISVLAACYLGKLTVWLRGPVFQYFGRISYSLYLVHDIVGSLFLSYAYKTGMRSPLFLVTAVVLATALSVGVAQVMYLIVEKPTVRLSRRLKSFKRISAKTD